MTKTATVNRKKQLSRCHVDQTLHLSSSRTSVSYVETHVWPRPIPRTENTGVVWYDVQLLIEDLDSFKKVKLDACDVRDDEWGSSAHQDGRCSQWLARSRRANHKECISLFRGPRNLKYFGSVKVEQAEDEAFTPVVNYLTEDRSPIWNSVGLHEQYALYQGEYLTRRTKLSGTGIVTFRSKASKVLKLASNEEDDHDTAISKVINSLW